MLGPKFIKKLDATAKIPKKRWMLGPKFLKKLGAMAKIPKKAGCSGRDS